MDWRTIGYERVLLPIDKIKVGEWIPEGVYTAQSTIEAPGYFENPRPMKWKINEKQVRMPLPSLPDRCSIPREHIDPYPSGCYRAEDTKWGAEAGVISPSNSWPMYKFAQGFLLAKDFRVWSRKVKVDEEQTGS